MDDIRYSSMLVGLHSFASKLSYLSFEKKFLAQAILLCIANFAHINTNFRETVANEEFALHNYL